MGKFIVIVVIAFLGFAWYKGWMGQWFNAALDSGQQGVRSTHQDLKKQRPADPGAPEEKK